MAPRKFTEKKAVEMLEKHALKTMWGRVALREARVKIEDYVYLKNSIDACITRPVTDAVGRLAVDKDLKQLFDRIDIVKASVVESLNYMKTITKYPKMYLQWMDNATKKMDSDIKSKYDSINNLHDMTLQQDYLC